MADPYDFAARDNTEIDALFAQLANLSEREVPQVQRRDILMQLMKAHSTG